jgi:hypothetical protein
VAVDREALSRPNSQRVVAPRDEEKSILSVGDGVRTLYTVILFSSSEELRRRIETWFIFGLEIH